MVMTYEEQAHMLAGRRSGEGLVMVADRSKEFRKAARRTRLVRKLRIALPLVAVALLGVYGLTIAETAGLVGEERVADMIVRQILPEDLAMKNPRYEGFMKGGGRYAFTAKTARQELATPHIINLDTITGQVFQANNTRTDIDAVRGVFDNDKSILELYEKINVVSQSGMKARLTRATILTKEDLMTSDEPVVVEFPNGTIRSNQMALRQKAREATFADAVAVELTPPAKEQDPAPAAQSSSLFTPTNGPINIESSRLDLYDAKKTALFTGEVRARQNDSNLTTPELEVTYEGDGLMGESGGAKDGQAAGDNTAAPAASSSPVSKVKRIVAKKPVVMKRANGDVVTSDTADFDTESQTAVLEGEVIMTSGTDRRATGDRVAINAADSTVFLIGNVAVSQGGNEMHGSRLEIDRKRGTAVMTTPAEGAAPAGRITAHLIRAAESKAPAPGKTDPAGGAGVGGLMTFKTDPKAPIDIEADRLDVDDQKKKAVFRGDVDATQGGFKILCAEMHAFYKGNTGLMEVADPGAARAPGEKGSELTRIEARKDVRVTSKDGQTATGDWADYDAKTNMITMGGNVVLSRGKNMVRGTRLLIDMTTGESKIDTAPQNTVAHPGGGGWVTEAPTEPTTEAKGRASAVFFPQELKEGEKDSKTRGAKSAKQSATPPDGKGTDGWSATVPQGPPPGTRN